ncbi:MAG TPA: SGNH/GDSL hydrolase family protein [Verrucomicrobiae bacterium]|nr:SGNH/GDSL hydrolase family protein [Verrucomicrobiae bacterium]
MRLKLIPLAGLLTATLSVGQTYEQKPADPAFENFNPVAAPEPKGLMLRRGDRLAICGDSITEQRKYSRLMEDYLTVCVPELEVTVRQYGWSGERAPGFLARMTNDCLRFKPTIATTCYGMNDHEYRPYEQRIGDTYRQSSTGVVEAFKANGARVIQGSPGCVGKIPFWVKSATGTVEDLNLNLCTLRNIGIEIAGQERVGFADVFWPMLVAGVNARKEYGTNYAIAGKDGVHPAWAGHTVMAYAFLKALGINGDIGTFTVDLKRGKLKTSKGHEVLGARNGTYTIRSSRYPFCGCVENNVAKDLYPTCSNDDLGSDNSIRSAMTLIPFNRDLNRLMLVCKKASAGSYKITWGDVSKQFTAQQLEKGINLADEFPANPFSAAFAKVDAAVASKQEFETRQIKESFRSGEARTNMEAVVERTERERAPLAEAIKAAFVPVTHELTIEPAS